MSIQIRQATLNDIPALHSLVAELASHLGEADHFTSTVDRFEKDFQDNFFHAIVADNGEEIVGMALYCFVYSTWKGRMIYLEDFVISKRHRRQGIGQLLWDALLQRGRDRDCAMLKWQVVADDAAAMRFYNKQNPVFEDQWLNGKVML
jgi:GNAT superfamily N-acetyltransferase